MTKSLVEMAVEIAQAQGSANSMSVEDMQTALKETFITLQKLQQIEAGSNEDMLETKASKVAPEKSILKNKIICLECGEEFRSLSHKHLKSHGMTGRDYRIKYGFSLRQPLCAKSITEKRKADGKKRGIPDALKKSIAAKKRANARKKKTAAKK